MIKIPQNNQFNVTNGAEVKPNIVFTKNVDFDEEGYIKLSPPMPQIITDTDDADFGQCVDMFNYDTYDYKAVTDDGMFDVNLNNTATIVKDSAGTAIGGGTDSRVAGYGSTDEVLVSMSGDIYEYNDPTWTARNSQNVGLITEFPSRQTWVAYGSNEVKQYSTANLDDSPLSTTSTGPDLSLPNYLEVTGLAYSNYRIGISTFHEQQGNAFFLTWDGSTTTAQTGTPVDAPAILDCIAYKNSWAIVTSRGQLLYFNGGGFEELGNFPPYFFRVNWINALGSSFQFGKLLSVENDLIYINIGSMLDSDEDDSGILPGFYSGVWCYDPLVGLYHKSGLSHSKLFNTSLTPSAGVYTSDAHKLVTGDRIVYDEKTYFAIRVTDDTFKVADTYDLAVLETATSDTVSGEMSWVKRTDWSQLVYYNNLVGCVKKFDNNASQVDGFVPFFAGAFMNKIDLGGDNMLCISAPKFDNIGAVEYYKVKSNEVEDIWQSIIVKHKPISEGDKIIVKYKIEDGPKERTLGESDDATPDYYATWTDADTFTFNDVRFDATGWEVGDEVEFMAGAGAGQTAHITAISETAGVWTVSVDESIRGASSGTRSTLAFSRYKKLATITKESSGFKGQSIIKLGKVSKWLQVKVEMRGNRITLEELIINNKIHNPVL